MCEKAAEAHRLKGAISRRRASSEYSSSGRDSLSSVDAILAKNLSASAQVMIPPFTMTIFYNNVIMVELIPL